MTEVNERIRDQHTAVSLLQAFGLALAVVVVEYFARLYVAAWLPTLGAPRVNDMLSSAVFYSLLVLATASRDRLRLGTFGRTARAIVAHARTEWVWAGLALAAARLSLIDEWLWGDVRLPLPEAPPNPAVVFPEAGAALAIVSLLLVNGIVVPFAEEWLWRGLIQPRFVGVLGFLPGLLLTALLFSLKHAIVDASLGRLLALMVIGLIFGYVASRRGWKASAAVHITANLIGTVVLLITSGGDV